jgi:hypothetical protein
MQQPIIESQELPFVQICCKTYKETTGLANTMISMNAQAPSLYGKIAYHILDTRIFIYGINEVILDAWISILKEFHVIDETDTMLAYNVSDLFLENIFT